MIPKIIWDFMSFKIGNLSGKVTLRADCTFLYKFQPQKTFLFNDYNDKLVEIITEQQFLPLPYTPLSKW